MTTLTMKEEKRLEVIQRVYRSELTMEKAALVLGISERQGYRVKARVSEDGAKGVVHGNRGRACKRKLKEKIVKQIVELAKGEVQRLQRSPSEREARRARTDQAVSGEAAPVASRTRHRITEKAPRGQAPQPARKTSQ